MANKDKVPSGRAKVGDGHKPVRTATKKSGGVKTTYVFVQLQGKFVPAGRLDFYDRGLDVRKNINDPNRFAASFQYGSRYAARPDAIPVDPAMLPLPEPGAPTAPIATPEGFEVFNGIRDASPDGWGRYLMTKAAPDKVYDEFDFLVASGDDRVGALAFGQDPRAEPNRIEFWSHDDSTLMGKMPNLGCLVDAVDGVLESDDLPRESRILLDCGLSLGGARPKATFDYMGKHWLAKFGTKSDGYQVNRAERSAMELAEKCGLDVPKTILRQVGSTTVYLIRRFDRPDMGSGLTESPRTPFVSALTLLGAHELMAHRYGYRDIAEAIRRYGSRPKEDLVELFRRMVLNILVGNDDDHLRNHGFLYEKKGWKLSPGYDITPKPQTGYSRRLVLEVGDHGKDATLMNALSQCHVFGLRRDEAEIMVESMRKIVAENWRHICGNNGIPDADMPRMETCFREAMDPQGYDIGNQSKPQ